MDQLQKLYQSKNELEEQINIIRSKKRRIGITLPLEGSEQENNLIFELEDTIIKIKNLLK